MSGANTNPVIFQLVNLFLHDYRIGAFRHHGTGHDAYTFALVTDAVESFTGVGSANFSQFSNPVCGQAF